jgi:hypothetical protein
MNRIIETIKRTTRIAAVGAFAVTLLPATSQAAVTEPLDTGAALFMPADAVALGYENYGIDSGMVMSPLQFLQRSGVDSVESPEELEETGITSISDLMLDPIDGTLQPGEPQTSFYSTITAYESAELAEADFQSTWRPAESDDEITILDENPGFGADSVMFQEGYESESDGTVTIKTITFIYENVQVDVAVIGYDEDVDPDLVAAAADIVEEKVESLIDDGEIDRDPVPGLSMRTPRYEGEGLVPGRAHYFIYNGEALVDAYYADSTEEVQDRADEYDIIAFYGTSVEFQLADATRDDDPLLRPRIASFATADDAEVYVESRIDDLISTGDFENIEELDLPAGAYEDDAALALTYGYTDATGTYEATRVVVQDGTSVYDLTLTGFTAPDLDVVLSMLDDAVACGQSGCAETLEPPAELMSYFEEQQEIWMNESGS